MGYMKNIDVSKTSPIAVMSICNDSAIAIYDVLYGIDDRVVVGFVVGDKVHNATNRKIYYLNEKPYIRIGNHRYYIENFIENTSNPKLYFK